MRIDTIWLQTVFLVHSWKAEREPGPSPSAFREDGLRLSQVVLASFRMWSLRHELVWLAQDVACSRLHWSKDFFVYSCPLLTTLFFLFESSTRTQHPTQRLASRSADQTSMYVCMYVCIIVLVYLKLCLLKSLFDYGPHRCFVIQWKPVCLQKGTGVG